MLAACQGIREIGFVAGLACAFLSMHGCSHFAAVGRGGPVYAISVDSVNGRKTADRGPAGYPACAIQVGDRVAQAWLADESRGDVMSPAILEGDMAALKEGILVERSWSQAVVHKVTDDELAAGAAVVYVPGIPRPTVVELRFVRLRLGGRPQSAAQGAESTRRFGLARAAAPPQGAWEGPLRDPHGVASRRGRSGKAGPPGAWIGYWID